MTPIPYYDDGQITIYCGDCRDVLPTLPSVDLVLTDPPYGIRYSSGMTGHHGGTALPGILGDEDASLRDYVLCAVVAPALVFGTWKMPPPPGCRTVLIWDKGDHVGMGDLSVPWKPNWEAIYVLGDGYQGRRDGAILRFPAPVTWNSTVNGRRHPHEKPVPLLRALLRKHGGNLILDPFMGVGSTLRAAKDLDRRAIGIEIEERYCEIAVQRLAQSVLPLEVS